MLAYSSTVCIEDLPKDKALRFFQIMAKHRVEYIITNDVSVETTEAAKQVGGFHWKIEQFHREAKQLDPFPNSPLFPFSHAALSSKL